MLPKIIVLKIRFSGGEDDVFLFNNKKDAEEKCYSYFEDYVCQGILTKREFYSLSFSNFESSLFQNDIGYFSMTEQEVL